MPNKFNSSNFQTSQFFKGVRRFYIWNEIDFLNAKGKKETSILETEMKLTLRNLHHHL